MADRERQLVRALRGEIEVSDKQEASEDEEVRGGPVRVGVKLS